MLKCIKKLGGFGEQNREHCELVLSTAAVAFRPLTVMELAGIVYTPAEDMPYLPEEVDLSTLVAKM